MRPDQRLEQCKSALTSRGVRDVKFQFGNISEKPLSHVVEDVAEALEAANAGQYREAPKLGDSMRG